MIKPDDRVNRIFQCIVEQYIETAQPVGSRAVSKIYEGQLSPASIRNVMADLEESGFIQQPHTSAGRIPTEKGYRYYVDYLMGKATEVVFDIPEFRDLIQDVEDIESAAEMLSRELAELANNASVMLLKKVRRFSFLDQQRPRVPSRMDDEPRLNDRLYVDGTRKIIAQPEFRDSQRMSDLLKTLDDKGPLLEFLENDLKERQLHIYIGSEVDYLRLSGLSIISREYCLDDEPIGCMAVIGPTRMRYDRTIRIVERMADAMTDYLNELK